MKSYERFLRYVMYNTKSDAASETVPSTEGQLSFAKELYEELRALGVSELVLDEYGYLYGKLPSNLEGEAKVPVIGFIAHLDTAPNLDSPHRLPRLIQEYDGSVIHLTNETVHDPECDPVLKRSIGSDIIVTDGTTLLGGDDKAGVAEIVTLAEYVLTHPEYRHGTIAFAFTPDEEIGGSMSSFDIERFGADIAYTLDGDEFGTIEYENFCSGTAILTFKGLSTHPGYAKGRMKNALNIATEFHAMIPAWERPEHTEGYEGFYHLVEWNGTCAECTVGYLLRDFDADAFNKRVSTLAKAAEWINEQYGEETAAMQFIPGNNNMAELIKEKYDVVQMVMDAIKDCGKTPRITPIRGGTDGVKLTYRGIPCPNLGNGSVHHHTAMEFVNVNQMDQCVELMLRICSRFVGRSSLPSEEQLT